MRIFRLQFGKYLRGQKALEEWFQKKEKEGIIFLDNVNSPHKGLVKDFGVLELHYRFKFKKRPEKGIIVLKIEQVDL